MICVPLPSNIHMCVIHTCVDIGGGGGTQIMWEVGLNRITKGILTIILDVWMWSTMHAHASDKQLQDAEMQGYRASKNST